MERKLASVQKILDIQPIEGADMIECVSVLGWQCVAKRGEFKPNDLCTYFEIDSFLPIDPKFEFLRKSSFRKMGDEEGFRLRTIKLRGQISQGLVLPIDILPEGNWEIGTDVTELLSVKKWDPPIPVSLRGTIKGLFPGFLHKTDETRVQSEPNVLKEMFGRAYYISTKMDGTSSTYYMNNGEFGVCGRNYEYLEAEKDNAYWTIAKLLEMKKTLAKAGNYAVQGEICGPGIQKNPLKLSKIGFYAFNVFSIDKGRNLDYNQFIDFCTVLNIPTVPIEELGDSFNYTSVQAILERAEGNYESGSKKEGIVIRPQEEMYSRTLGGRLSFKAINNQFLLSEK